MKKILSIALIFSLGFATTRVVCENTIGGNGYGNSTQRCWCASGVAYTSIGEALNDAKNNDEIIICPRSRGAVGYYKESDLNITDSGIYLHSYNNEGRVVIYDDSGKPIFNIQESSVTLRALTIKQDSSQIDINVTGNINSLVFQDLNIISNGKGIVLQNNINNTFNDVNITSADVSFESDWSEFYGVKILNSEFNQTSSDKYVFLSFATNCKDNNFTNVKLHSSGYGVKFESLIDSNFSYFYLDSSNDAFVVNSNDVSNIRFVDSNSSSNNGRAFSVNNGSLVNSVFKDFNLSANYEALYTYDDIVSSKFSNFVVDGGSGFRADRYIRKSSFESGKIEASYAGIYSSKEFNQSKINNLYIKSSDYGLYFSENSDIGAVNDENNLTNLRIVQTSNADTKYAGIRFKKKAGNSYFSDINITATEKALWFSTGGYNNTLIDLELNSSESNSLGNSYLWKDNKFSNINLYSYESGLVFNGDAKGNIFENFYIQSKTSNGIYGSTDINVSGNEFSNFKIFADDYGIYFKDSVSENNFSNFYVRVNNQKGFKFAKYSTDENFFNIDSNGTKAIEFNISQRDNIEKAKLTSSKYATLYFYNIYSFVNLYDLNVTSSNNACIYIDNLGGDVNISTKIAYKNEFNCSTYNGIFINNGSNSYSLDVENSNFKFNATSTDTSRALIKADVLKNLYVKNNFFDGNRTRRGIYITSNLDNLYVYKNIFKDTNDSSIYINRVNNYLDIEENNISNGEYGVYLYNVASSFNKGEIKRNYFIRNSNYAIDIFDNNEKSANFEIWTNCFYYNQNQDASQAYTYDSIAKYDDGKAGNFWSDWNESGKYAIDPIPIYDNHPLYYCPLDVLFDARDVDRNFSDRNISIKIAGKDFNLTIFNITKGQYKGTVCSRILNNDNNDTAYTPWMRLYFNDEAEKNLTNIEVNHSVRDAIVHIVWADGDKSCDEVLNGDHNASFSTDTFAIRPYKYSVKFSQMPLYAGEEFNLSVDAVDYFNNLLTDYNESDVNITADMNKSNLVCEYPHAEFNLSSLEFINGNSNNSAKFDEVGEMNLTIFDNHFDEAKGGADECNSSSKCIEVYGYDGKDSKGVFCCDISANPRWDVNLSEVDVKVYDLNITKVEINTSNQKDWIYMDSNLSEFNASPIIEVTAFNKSGKQLHNFDKLCLAKDMNVSFRYYVHNDNGDINLTYIGTTSDNNKSIKDFNKTVEINKSMFVKGDTNTSYSFNVDRNISKALYVVYGNLKEINFTTNKIAKNENNLSTDLNISMYYGNIQTFDVTTNENSIDIKVYFVVYDDDSDYKPSNINEAFNWYLNSYHSNKEGNLTSVIHISNDYNASDKYNSKFDIQVEDVNKGEEIIHITRKDDTINFAVFHLTLDGNASHWLWFNYNGNEYNDSIGTTCAHHFCFAITWKEANNEDNSKTVKSGDNLLGTEAPVSEYNRTSKGVKIYR